MGRPVTKIELIPEDRQTLEQWVRANRTEKRLVFRAQIVLLSTMGLTTQEIAYRQHTRVGTVTKWRSRYLKDGIKALQDAPRPGTPHTYAAGIEKKILSVLDDPPPKGYATWTGKLVSQRLRNVSSHQVWRVLKRFGIHLQRRHSWCISTDPEFTPKAADIVGIYLNPPDNAIVLSVDEKPSIQALERAQGYLKFPNGKALTGYNHEYTRHGTSTLFAALNVLTGKIFADHYNRRRRVEFLDFMNQVIADYPNQEIHVILDNLKTHKPKYDKWQSRHKNVHFHYTPTHASWLNQIECWFSILWRSALKGASFTAIKQLRNAIDSFIAAYNKTAHPFQWRKSFVQQKHFINYANLCN
jgi:transposase